MTPDTTYQSDGALESPFVGAIPEALADSPPPESAADKLADKHKLPRYTVPEPTHVLVEEQAAPVRVQITVPSDKMKIEMDAKFNNFVGSLTPAQEKALTKGGYRNITRERVYKKFGGMVAFYGDMLYDALTREVAKRGREILTVHSLEAQEMPQGFVMQGVAYLEPQVTWRKDPPATFKVTIPSITDAAVEAALATRLAEIQEQHAIYTPVERTQLAAGDYVTLTVETAIDGEPSVPLSFKERRIQYGHNEGTFFLDAELGKDTSLQSRSFDFLQPKDDPEGRDAEGKPLPLPFGGQQFKGTIVIHRVDMKELPPITDDLALDANWESLAQMQGTFRKEIEDQLTKAHEEQVIGLVWRSIADNSTVGAVPELWARRKAEELVNNQLEALGGSEKKLAQQFGIKDLGTLGNIYYHQLRQQLALQMVIRSWGIMHGVDGDKTLNGTNQYVEAVRRHILNTIEIDDGEGEPKLQPWWDMVHKRPSGLTDRLEVRTDETGPEARDAGASE